MIYPQRQFQMESGREQLKKEALELIISLYINRRKNEEIEFLIENFGLTEELAEGIRTSLTDGLSLKKVATHRIYYGENSKEDPKNCKSFCDFFKQEFFCIRFLIVFCLFLAIGFYGVARNNVTYKFNGFMIFCFIIIGAALRITISAVFSKRLAQSARQKNKSTTYTVQRNGKKMEVEESDIVVGDIVKLGFKQCAPASGIMISGKNIFVKEGFHKSGEERIQNKMTLEDCITKIQSMSSLELKIGFQQQMLPSPVVLRGSELVQGSTYWIMVLSVTEEQILKNKGFEKKDIFKCDQYEHWAKMLELKWKKVSLIAMLISFIIICFTTFTDFRLYGKTSTFSIDLIFEIMGKVGALLVIIDAAPLRGFLYIYFMKLLVSLKITDKFQKLLLIEKIILNEKNIMDYDKILVESYAVCEKRDMICQKELLSLDPVTFSMIKEIEAVFELIPKDQVAGDDEEQEKSKKIFHVNKKKIKIVSSVVQPTSNTAVLKNVLKEIAKISDNNSPNPAINPRPIQNSRSKQKVRTSVRNNEKIVLSSLLSVPKIDSDSEQIDDILHNRCKVKSRGLISDIANIAEKGYRTYYFEIFEQSRLEDITHILSNGKVEVLNGENRERMNMLAKQMSVIYDLTPVMIGYNEGTYNQRPFKMLVGLLGINISDDNKMINYLKQFESVGIRSMITIDSINCDSKESEKDIMQEYRDRKWVNMAPGELYNMKDVKKELGRLVCGNCLIANCDCKNKNIEVSNVQPFLAISDTAKIIYDLDEDDVQYLESSYRQLRYDYLLINSQNSSALNVLQSLKETLIFVQGLIRTLPLLYLVPLFFFMPAILFWIRDIEILYPRQIAFLALLYQIELLLILYVRLEIPVPETDKFNHKKIKVMDKKITLFLYIMVALIVIVTQLMYNLSYLIPEERDRYDELMDKYGLDPHVCKYSQDGEGVSNRFAFSQCQVPILEVGQSQFQIFGKLSTMMVIYIQFCLAFIVVARSRNFRSVTVMIEYLLCIGTIIYMVFRGWAHSCIYPYQLTLHQWLITLTLSTATCLLAFILATILSRLQISNYFLAQLQSCIELQKEEKGLHYSSILKDYYEMRKRQKLRSMRNNNNYPHTSNNSL